MKRNLDYLPAVKVIDGTLRHTSRYYIKTISHLEFFSFFDKDLHMRRRLVDAQMTLYY